ncbi:MAG: GNAT family N-acetyltransferase [Deltaproteobacteria bacterium]|nr:GNAT family N-acetyltransferase [Deltaproteobacteria bacterium]
MDLKESGERWDLALEQFPDAPYSLLYGWRRVYEEGLRLPTYYLLAEGPREVVGVCPLVLMKGFGPGRPDYFISLPYQTRSGLWAVNPEAREGMLRAVGQLAGERRVGTVELRELDHQEAAGDVPLNREHVEMVLELPGDWKTYERQIGPRVRQMRRARSLGLTVRQGRDEKLLADFYRVFSLRMRELLFPVYPRSFFRKILEVFPGRSGLVLVYKGDRPLAGMLRLEFRDTVSAPYVAALQGAQEEYPNQLLYFEAIRQAWEGGFRFFNFCRSQVDSGTYRFKRQWQARPQPLQYSYPRVRPGRPVLSVEQARQSLTYRLAEQVWPRLPLSWTQWLGGRIIRRLVIA